MTPSRTCLATLLCILAGAGAARAESVAQLQSPRERGSWVVDSAGVMSAGERLGIDRTADQLSSENGAEIAVVTVSNTGSLTPKDFAHQLFNRWGVGKEGADNGVLVLLVMDARRVEVETGYGVEGTLPDGKVGDILDRHAVPEFKRGRFGAGLEATVEALSDELRGLPSARGTARRKGGVPWWLAILGVGLALGGGGWGVWLSRRPQRCTRCGADMRLLTPQQEKAYLSEDRAFEEEIGSVDHRVWRCDPCKELTVTSSNKWFSGFESCQTCSRRTGVRSSCVTMAPTYSSSGSREVRVSCRLPRCGSVRTWTEAIPRKVRSSSSSSSSFSSSSSSSSSFGGGSSGGGGAGRSW